MTHAKWCKAFCELFISFFMFTPSHKEIIHKEMLWSNVIIPD